MGRVCVQRVALYENTRAARAIKREAGGFRLRDAMHACGALACAQRARGARRRPRPHFTVGKVTCHKWGLLTASVLVTLLQGGSDQDGFLFMYFVVGVSPLLLPPCVRLLRA